MAVQPHRNRPDAPFISWKILGPEIQREVAEMVEPHGFELDDAMVTLESHLFCAALEFRSRWDTVGFLADHPRVEQKANDYFSCDVVNVERNKIFVTWYVDVGD